MKWLRGGEEKRSRDIVPRTPTARSLFKLKKNNKRNNCSLFKELNMKKVFTNWVGATLNICGKTVKSIPNERQQLYTPIQLLPGKHYLILFLWWSAHVICSMKHLAGQDQQSAHALLCNAVKEKYKMSFDLIPVEDAAIEFYLEQIHAWRKTYLSWKKT